MDYLHKIGHLLCYAGATREEWQSIYPELCEHNRKRILIFSLVTIFFLSAMVIITYRDPDLGFGYWIYLVPLLIIVVIHLVVRFFVQHRPLVLAFMVYAFISVLYLMAIYIGAIANTAQTAGTFLAFLLAIPMLFVMKPWENICMLVFFDLLFVLTTAQVKSPDLVSIDVINAFIFGGIGIVVSTFMLTITVENFVIKDKMTFLAERDQLTRLRNRTSYEHRLPVYPGHCRKTLACVYADANGLHELNETGGHLAGDNMLQFVAQSLQAQFGEADTYRIGGDEFVAFAVDLEEADVREKISAFIAKVEEAGYFVSVGCALQQAGEIQMPELIKAAEEEMYREKNAFYQRSESNRRRGR